MSRGKFMWIGFACVGALITLSASAQQGQTVSPTMIVQPQAGGTEYFAANLGIYYRLVPYNASSNGFNPNTGNYDPSNPPGGGGYGGYTYGARLTRYPIPNSPAASVQFEPGDMIISLDGLPIYGPDDVRNHRYWTDIIFINIRTGQPQYARVYIP